MKVEFVDLKRQLFEGDGELYNRIMDSIEKGVKDTSFILGPALEKFESQFADFCDAEYCVGLNSGTDALEFALRCKGIGGGNVITVPNSYFTTASSISLAGSTPSFVDVDERTFNIDVEKLAEAVDENTKAILPVHLYGRPADMEGIRRIADQYGIPIIEDCCHAPGAKFNDSPVPIADVGCFSFFPGKNIGCWGDGGALVTNDKEVAEKARMWRDDGTTAKYHHKILGRKARLDPIQARILSVKLDYLNGWNEQRRQHAKLYDNLLKGIDGLQLPVLDQEGIEPVFHLYTVHADRRDGLLNHLRSKGIAAGMHYPTPIHLQPAYKHLNFREGSFPVAEKLAKTTLSLPMFPEIRKDEIEYVCENVRNYLS